MAKHRKNRYTDKTKTQNTEEFDPKFISACEGYMNRIYKLKAKSVIGPVRDILTDIVINQVEKTLSSKPLTISPECFRPNYIYKKYSGRRLIEESEILLYARSFPFYGGRNWVGVITNTAKNGRFGQLIYQTALKCSAALQSIIAEGKPYKDAWLFEADKEIQRKLSMYSLVFAKSIEDEMTAYFTQDKVLSCLTKNPHHKDMLSAALTRENSEKALRKNMLETIPETYPELFPAAREMRRHFILHVGPTNSGKTYAAVQSFKENLSCTYLAPLRLLAYEQFESLNRNGIICSMRTGEEHIDIPGANCMASTIEMADLENTVDVAVIDEGQLINDPSRGGAWTAALLGLQAREIHVCMAPEAEKLYKKLIRECGDTVEVVKHERLCPLTIEKGNFTFPKDVQDGDALIVFSRKDVHAVASELQRRHIKTSVIYGKLPYDVRHSQAADFTNGTTNVLVATDAIGMGLNLPIKRVVFLMMEKFDGTKKRPVLPEEIRQIAGRAGRKGIYPEGFVNSEYDRKAIRHAFNGNPVDLTNAVIAFPKTLISLDAALEDILKRWDEIPVKEGFEKEDMKEKLFLCHSISNLSQDKDFLYDCITIAFDSENELLLDMWKELCASEAMGKEPRILQKIPYVPDRAYDARDLDELEGQFRVCDLLYGFCDKFRHFGYTEAIMTCKKELSDKIISILDKQALKGRTCKSCGKTIPWNYPYGICRVCYEKQYSWDW